METLPVEFRLSLDANARWIGDGETLAGGSPLRLLRLTPAGRTLVDRLTAGDAVPPSAAAQALIRRLLDAGLAHPRPPAAAGSGGVAVVIPVRDDPPGLAATLHALSRTGLDPTVVVDDSSARPDQIAGACPSVGVTLIRRQTWSGPAGARNAGWRSVDDPFVAFVDANCEPEDGWLERLTPHFADPQVGAVAPRIVPESGTEAPGWLAAYEAVASPLDLGGREAIVRPRSPVAYVPTAALVVRRAVLEELGGFDEGLVVGEDVDFIWRMVAAGWTVRYEPRAVVRHPIRPGWRPWLAQRFRYGTSAAPLARRHGSAVAPAVMSPWTVAAWALAASGHPGLGLATAGYSVTALAGLLPPTFGVPPFRTSATEERQSGTGRGGRASDLRIPAREAVRLAGLGHLRGGVGLARAIRRAWAPLAVGLAVTSRRSRPALVAAAVVPGLLAWFGRRPRLDPARFVALNLVDDLAYAAGVWAGCARERTGRALLPDFAVRHSNP